jgi:hypothetical protein
MTQTLKIHTETVGQSFGCVGIVTEGDRVVYTTDIVPYGMESVARDRAAAWVAQSHGHDSKGQDTR